MTRAPPTSTLFPYTTLFRSQYEHVARKLIEFCRRQKGVRHMHDVKPQHINQMRAEWMDARRARTTDRKSTRLNSSHMSISYAVLCLKKKSAARRQIDHDRKS